jgi:MraZ protein
MFFGQYNIKIDKRRRLRIPAVFMKIMNQQQIVIEKNYFQPSLEIMPFSVFEKKVDFIKSHLNSFKKDHARFLEAFFANFLLFEADKQIIYLPTDFYNHLQLKGKNELKVIGMNESFRVSASDEWEEKHKNDQAIFTGFFHKLHDE